MQIIIFIWMGIYIFIRSFFALMKWEAAICHLIKTKPNQAKTKCSNDKAIEN